MDVDVMADAAAAFRPPCDPPAKRAGRGTALAHFRARATRLPLPSTGRAGVRGENGESDRLYKTEMRPALTCLRKAEAEPIRLGFLYGSPRGSNSCGVMLTSSLSA